MASSRILFAAFAAALFATGCCGAPTPHGERGVLDYHNEFSLVQGGLWYSVLIPAGISTGGGKLDVCPRQTQTWDFEGTEIQAEAEGGAEFLESARNENGAWVLKVRCPQGGSAGALTVRVMKDGQARYEDTLPTPCATADELSFALMGEAKPKMMVGAPFALSYQLTRPSFGSHNPLTLGGHGMVGADGALTVESESWDHLVVHGIRPALHPPVQAGALTAEAPVELVDESAVGRVELLTEKSAPDQFRLTAQLFTAGADEIGGGQCAWTVEGFGQSYHLVPQYGEEDTCRKYLQVSDGTQGQVCVTSAGRTTCADLTR